MRDYLVVPNKEIDLPQLGKVHLRAWGLRARLAFISSREEASSDVDTALEMLAITVLDDDGEAIWDAQGWDIFCGAYPDESMELISQCRAVAGLDAEDAKKK